MINHKPNPFYFGGRHFFPNLERYDQIGYDSKRSVTHTYSLVKIINFFYKSRYSSI